MFDHTLLNLRITRSDIRPHIKWAVNHVITHGHFNLLQGLCGYVFVNILTLSTLRGHNKVKESNAAIIVLIAENHKTSVIIHIYWSALLYSIEPFKENFVLLW